MDAILFSADTKLININDAIRHLTVNKELYWEVGFRILPEKFQYPLNGYIHICGNQVEYVATIIKIIPFSRCQYENNDLTIRIKPFEWIRDWHENNNNIRNYHWKYTLIMTHLESFSFNTYRFQKYDGSYVQRAPQNYIRVLPPFK
jgi:hypothetical protein